MKSSSLTESNNVGKEHSCGREEVCNGLGVVDSSSSLFDSIIQKVLDLALGDKAEASRPHFLVFAPLFVDFLHHSISDILGKERVYYGSTFGSRLEYLLLSFIDIGVVDQEHSSSKGKEHNHGDGIVEGLVSVCTVQGTVTSESEIWYSTNGSKNRMHDLRDVSVFELFGWIDENFVVTFVDILSLLEAGMEEEGLSHVIVVSIVRVTVSEELDMVSPDGKREDVATCTFHDKDDRLGLDGEEE